MHFDALTLAAVVHELQQTLTGGRVQQVLLPDAHSVGLEVYARRARHYLLISAAPGAGCLYLASQKLRRGVEKETPLLLLLRKYVRESLLARIEQPDPTERIVHFHCDHPAHGTTTLVAEPMGRLSNLLLLNPAGMILECVQRVRPGEHAQRVLMPGKPYSPPRPQPRLAPWDDGSDEYDVRLATLLARPGPLWKAIAEGVAGSSPTLGREVAWRVLGDANAPARAADASAVAQVLRELWNAAYAPQPGVWLEQGRAVGYSAYGVGFRPGFTPRATMSQAIEEVLSVATGTSPTVPAGSDPYAALRRQTAAQLEAARRRVRRRLEAAQGDLPDPDAAARVRREAEWLLALHHQITPGQTRLEIELGDGASFVIELDPTLSPIEQAQRRFKQAGKWDRAAQHIPARLAQLEGDLAFLDQLASDLALAENQPQIAAVAAELARSGLLPPRPDRPAPPRVADPLLRVYAASGFEIVVGRNARQNEKVTFEIATAADLWLHARDAPGAHVVIRSGGRTVDDETLQQAAQLAAYHSARRGERAVAVMVAPRRMVSRHPGGRPGLVQVRDSATVTVPAELPAQAATR